MLEYIIENASQVMRLCFGFGFLILMIVISHSVLVFTKVAQKIDRVADIILKLVSTPVALSLQLKEIVDHVSNYLGKKDK